MKFKIPVVLAAAALINLGPEFDPQTGKLYLPRLGSAQQPKTKHPGDRRAKAKAARKASRQSRRK